MEAKDTVMTEEELQIFWRNPEDCDDVGIAESQAEISFTLGEEQGRQAGVKEVVEWLGLHRSETTRQFVGFTIDKKNWQAKLKEWGL